MLAQFNEVGIRSMRFLILECLTLLHAPIFSFYTVLMLYVVNEQVKRRAYDEHNYL